MLVVISCQDLGVGLGKANSVLSDHAALIIEHDQEEACGNFLIQAKLKIKYAGACRWLLETVLVHLRQVEARENAAQHAVTFDSCLDEQLAQKNLAASESGIEKRLQETSKVELSRIGLLLNHGDLENLLNAGEARLAVLVLQSCLEGRD